MPVRDYQEQPMITSSRVRELLRYDEANGTFAWLRNQGAARAGSVAGTGKPGAYRSIKLDGKRYYAHRLAWLLTTGTWPKGQIDHINGVRDDNRIANLRDVTQFENMQNLRTATAQNRSCGLLGASFEKRSGLWQSKIRLNGHQYHLGRYETADLAHAAYIEAKRLLHPNCTV